MHGLVATNPKQMRTLSRGLPNGSHADEETETNPSFSEFIF